MHRFSDKENLKHWTVYIVTNSSEAADWVQNRFNSALHSAQQCVGKFRKSCLNPFKIRLSKFRNTIKSLLPQTNSVNDSTARLFSLIESKIFQKFVFELLFVTCLYMLCCGKIRRILSDGLNVIKMKRIPIGIRLAIQYILCYAVGFSVFFQMIFIHQFIKP